MTKPTQGSMYCVRKRSATNRGWTERDTLKIAEYASLKL